MKQIRCYFWRNGRLWDNDCQLWFVRKCGTCHNAGFHVVLWCATVFLHIAEPTTWPKPLLWLREQGALPQRVRESFVFMVTRCDSSVRAAGHARNEHFGQNREFDPRWAQREGSVGVMVTLRFHTISCRSGAGTGRFNGAFKTQLLDNLFQFSLWFPLNTRLIWSYASTE